MSHSIRKRGRFWFFRGTVPARQADGTIGRIRIEESLRTERLTEARQRAEDLERHYHDLAYKPQTKRAPTFGEAALVYLQTRQKHDRFLEKLLAHFKETPVDQIDQAAVANACHTIYPRASASTHNRAVFAPVIAIMRVSGLNPNFQRPRHNRKQRSVPPDGWFDAVLPHCPPRLAALLAFLTLTGRRVSEAIALTEKDLDGNVAKIARTKTGEPVEVVLPEFVVDLLATAKRDFRGGTGERPSKQLFGYSSKDNAHRALKRICDIHGLPYYSSHSFGRHAFATRLLKQGWSVKHVARAGGWKSPMMVLKHYGHLEQDEVQEGVRKVQEAWSRGKGGARKKSG